MLGEFIEAYEEAMDAGNKEAMLRIEKQLQRLGMDKRSLMVIVQERRTRYENRVQSEG